MEEYKVSAAGNFVLIEKPGQDFIVKVYANKQTAPKAGTTTLAGTLYKEEGSFVQAGVYFFEAVTKYFEPVTGEISLADFKNAAAFYFTAILRTELFLIGIPRESSLCPGEIKVFEFEG